MRCKRINIQNISFQVIPAWEMARCSWCRAEWDLQHSRVYICTCKWIHWWKWNTWGCAPNGKDFIENGKAVMIAFVVVEMKNSTEVVKGIFFFFLFFALRHVPTSKTHWNHTALSQRWLLPWLGGGNWREKELLFFIVALKFLFSSNQIQFKQERKPAYRQQFIEISSN